MAGWVSELSLPSGKATELLILEQTRLHLSFSLMSRGNQGEQREWESGPQTALVLPGDRGPVGVSAVRGGQQG